jgi:hypothetical protein
VGDHRSGLVEEPLIINSDVLSYLMLYYFLEFATFLIQDCLEVVPGLCLLNFHHIVV